MKRTVTAMCFVVILGLLLSGCTTNEQSSSNLEKESAAQEIITPKVSADQTLIVYGLNNIDPNPLVVPVEEDTAIEIINRGSQKIRIGMPIYKSDVSVDLDPNEHNIVVVHPLYKGRVAIELNGIQVGYVIAE